MREIDPILLHEDLQQRVQKYLTTALPISNRFPSLQAEVERKLSLKDTLVKGPYVEALPDFPKGESLKDFVEQGVLHEGFAKLTTAEFERPLHRHQAAAIRNVCAEGKNLLVATGTGSGKTECFLYPLLDSLLKAGIHGRPGVRALLIYPLNALANDQLYHRLLPVIAGSLKEFGITVGRFTGQTEHDTGRARDAIEENKPLLESLGGDIPDNWKISRDQMLGTDHAAPDPPHVLVTNYAMLEHLLLLPKNRSLFSGADLKFVVLDEIHTYAGAQATEVALLLRKLKTRYCRPGSEPLYIGTSASLSPEPEAAAKISRFAGDLFGSTFPPPLKADRQPHHLLGKAQNSESLRAADWAKLHAILTSVRQGDEPDTGWTTDHWNEMVVDAEADCLLDDGQPLKPALCEHFAGDPNVQQAARLLADKDSKFIPFRDLAAKLFPGSPEAEAEEGLKGMISVGAFAREDDFSYPLLPARYHFFVTGIEDATLRLTAESESPDRFADLRFARVFRDGERERFRLMTCRKCGEAFVEAFENAARIRGSKLPGAFSRRAVFWLKPKESEVHSEEQVSEDETAPSAAQLNGCFVHLDDFRVVDRLGDDDDESEWWATRRAELRPPRSDAQGTDAILTKCPACGAVDQGEIITPFHPGDQAMSEVIAEVLYQHLPENKANVSQLPGRGRSLLVFSDNRQDAAFFAPSFQRRHEELLLRWGVMQVFKRHRGVTLMVEQLVSELAKRSEIKRGILNREGDPALPREVQDLVRRRVMAEFFTPAGSRNSLESLGLVDINYGPAFDELLESGIFDLFGDAAEHAPGILRWLLDSFRKTRSISMPLGITSKDTFTWGPYDQESRSFSLRPKGHVSYSLLPKNRPSGGHYNNRYHAFLHDKLGLSNWQEILSEFWKWCTEADDPLLCQETTGEPGHVLDFGHVDFTAVSESQVRRCESCGEVEAKDIGPFCAKWGCTGKMRRVSVEEFARDRQRNVYKYIYTELAALNGSIAREHTAALSNNLREDIEKDFKAGKVNLLSCSTTMEMGIDLGDLEAVFLRNVPPDIGNYQQRTGRAGRRAQAAPASVTYARNRRFDQVSYQETESYLKKQPRTPFVHLANERLYRRHQFSVLLAGYLGQSQSITNQPSVQIGQLFGLTRFEGKDSSPTPQDGGNITFGTDQELAFAQRLHDWLESKHADESFDLALEMGATVKNHLDPERYAALEIDRSQLAELFERELNAIAEEFGIRYRFYFDKHEQFMANATGSIDDGKRATHFLRLAYQWARQSLINFLSRYGVIPTYSFPVNNIRLEVVQNSQGPSQTPWKQEINLDRDARIGITEYAPGAEVIAKGRVWTSRGVGYYPHHFMPERFYRECENCRHVEPAEDRELLPAACPRCGSDWSNKPLRRFIEPRSFITSCEESQGKDPGPSRIRPPAAMETQLVSSAGDELFQERDLVDVSWAIQDAKSGTLMVVNKGKGNGFKRCRCGFTEIIPRNQNMLSYNLGAHHDPYTGDPCNGAGTHAAQDFAHIFRTDVLQVRLDHLIDVPQEHVTNGTAAEYRAELARTVAEAMRIALAEKLEILESEVAATFRWRYSDGPEVVIFDSVPGGAGYVSMFFRNESVSALIDAAIETLNCRNHCTTGCQKCLRTFSNQLFWDQFRRPEALAWLQKVKGFALEDFQNDLGAEKVDRSAILKRLEQDAKEITVFAPSLGDFVGPVWADVEQPKPLDHFYPAWQTYQAWLAAGKTVRIVSPLFPDFQDAKLPRAMFAADWFKPFYESGKLVFSRPDDLAAVPRRLRLLAKGVTSSEDIAIYQASGFAPALQEALGPDVFIGKGVPPDANKFVAEGITMLNAAQIENPNAFERKEYLPGAARNLAQDFDFLTEDVVKRISISDPYATANDEALATVLDLIDVWQQLWQEPPGELNLRYAEGYTQQERAQRTAVAKRLEQKLQTRLGANAKINIRGVPRTKTLDFHDRRIEFFVERTAKTSGRRRKRAAKKAVNQAPALMRKHLIELSGGISRLVDQAKECRLYRITDPQG